MRSSTLTSLALSLALACSSGSEGEDPADLCAGQADGPVMCPNPMGLVAPNAPRPVCGGMVNCSYSLDGLPQTASAPIEGICMDEVVTCSDGTEVVCAPPLSLCPPAPGMDGGMGDP